MRLVAFNSRYADYRENVIFDGYKWDPQFGDNNTIAPFALVLTAEEHQKLQDEVKLLYAETVAIERFLAWGLGLSNLENTADFKSVDKKLYKEIFKILRLPKKIRHYLEKASYHSFKHVRLMRFDFHPTDNGFAISEVNSDVPGGFAEGSIMPKLAIQALGRFSYVDFSEILVGEIIKKLPAKGRIGFVHCTSYSDDRQVMQFLGDRLEALGHKAVYLAADHVRFENGRAFSTLIGGESELDFIVRFNPLEWLVNVKSKELGGFFKDIPSCNHPLAILTQTKRLPLAFDALSAGVDLSNWRRLLPDTRSAKDTNKDGYILKPVYGRVGEGIGIQEACEKTEFDKIIKSAKRHPNDYILQRRFLSTPLEAGDGQFHVCIGAYAVEGMPAGYYARISQTPRIDSNAADIPVLIEGDTRIGKGGLV